MADSKTFDQYEYVAVITPGLVFLFGLSQVWPQQLDLSNYKDVSVGALGLILVAGYVAGQGLRAVGEPLEWLFWKALGGMPTDWVLKTKTWLISGPDRNKVEEQVQTLLKQPQFKFATVKDKIGHWHSLTRQIYAAISKAGHASRIDAFNRTYGLMRGFTIALVALGIVFLIFDPDQRWLAGVAFVLAALAFFLFFQSAISYARELFAQFLIL
jgi:hypothetical protein